MTRKTRNSGYGSATWLGDEWADGIARGAHASPEAARELADEVLHQRKARRELIEKVRTLGKMLEEHHGADARGFLCAAVAHLLTAEELYGCPPTDTPLSDASGDPPPRARLSG